MYFHCTSNVYICSAQWEPADSNLVKPNWKVFRNWDISKKRDNFKKMRHSQKMRCFQKMEYFQKIPNAGLGPLIQNEDHVSKAHSMRYRLCRETTIWLDLQMHELFSQKSVNPSENTRSQCGLADSNWGPRLKGTLNAV